MDEIVGGQVNQCFEMASGKATEYAEMYGKGGEQKKTFKRIQKDEKTKQTSLEPPVNPNKQSDSVIFSRSLCFMVAGLVVCFLTAAAAFGLALTIMFRISLITSSEAVTSRDAAKAQRLVDFPTKFQELKENISQLKKELDNARQELKEFIEIKNLSQQGKTLNLTSQVNNSLISLKDEVHSEERRINETVLLTVQHHDQMKFFEKLINSSRRYLVTEVTEMWSSINSTQKDLQQQTKAFWSSVWAAVNATKMELMQKVNNISKMAGTKSSGNFSRCKYEVKTGTTTTGGSDADAAVVEPAGYRILGETCSTNFAEHHNLVSKNQKYICICRGDSGHFRPLGNEKKKCNLHYWFCPIN
ncbi:uncharacterized protein [Montipora foliosa]|uniref:uncharacterized protein isoform X2 n=1 Tax=Montipora foliosa TaxID=591990 RepID=UPI0035F18E92